ncbi:MAG: hypothetical protein GOU98_00415 [Candidatus Altiarchaeota archaeon]|nr:hypothetical protein [Candidatus Altiarchaeota archaeon]
MMVGGSVFSGIGTLFKKVRGLIKKGVKSSVTYLIFGTAFLGFGFIFLLESMSAGVEKPLFVDIFLFMGIIMLLPAILSTARSKKNANKQAAEVRATAGVMVMGYSLSLLTLSLIFMLQDPGFGWNLLGLENPTGLLLMICAIEVILLLVFLRRSGKELNFIEFNIWGAFFAFLIVDFLIPMILSGNVFSFIIPGYGAPYPEMDVIATGVYLVVIKSLMIGLFLLMGARIKKIGGPDSSPMDAIKDGTNVIFLIVIILMVLIAVTMPAYFIFMQTTPEFQDTISVGNPMLGELFGNLRSSAGPTGDFVTGVAESLVPEGTDELVLELETTEVIGYLMWTQLFGFPTGIREYNETSETYVTTNIPESQIMVALIMFLALFVIVIKATDPNKIKYDDIEGTADEESVWKFWKRWQKRGGS